MKKVSSVLLIMLLCMVLGVGSVALASNEDSLKLLGTWEIDLPDEGQYAMKFGSNGVGEYSMEGQTVGQFSFVVRGNIMAGAMLDENGSVIYEKNDLTFVDENTVTKADGDNILTLKRIEASTEAAMIIDNAFLGTWTADLPEGDQVFEGVVMEYKADGTFSFKVDGGEGENSYLVLKDTMVSLSDEGEIEAFTFVVVDENNIDVTSAEGKTARFVRQAVNAEQAA